MDDSSPSFPSSAPIWEARLRAHLDVESSGRATRNILVVDRGLPTPDRDSGSLRMFRLLRHLRQRAWQVTFLPLDLDRREPYASNLEQLGVDVDCGGENPEDVFTRIGARFDAVLLSRPEPAIRLLPVVRAYAPDAALLYDTVDLHWRRFRRGAEIGATEAHGGIENMRATELTAAAHADVVLAISGEEAELLRRELPDVDVEVVSNVHDAVAPGAAFAERRGLLFVGGFLHHPNVDAVEWFAREILPLLRARRPELSLSVIGSDFPASLEGIDGIEALGWVPDLADALLRTRVFVAPLRYGAGLKGKLGEAFAAGVPVVTTSVGAEGFDLQTGIHALVADDPAAFAAAILRVHDDETLWEELARAGRELVAARCAPEVVGAALDAALERALQRRAIDA